MSGQEREARIAAIAADYERMSPSQKAEFIESVTNLVNHDHKRGKAQKAVA